MLKTDELYGGLYYKIRSHAGTGKFLNVEATGPISGRKNVGIWEEACPIDQIWSITSLGNNKQVKTINNLSYMLNAKTTTWDCDVYTSNADTYVNFELVSTGIYYIRLKSNTTKYLTASGTGSGSNVSWAELSSTSSGKQAQKWKVTTTSLPDVYTLWEQHLWVIIRWRQMQAIFTVTFRQKASVKMRFVEFSEIWKGKAP